MTIPRPFRSIHGKLRGLDAVGKSPVFEGRFGRMFRTLPAATFTVAELHALADVGHMVAEEEEDGPTAEGERDDEENSGPDPSHPIISAGYTYLGQFIDHEFTPPTTPFVVPVSSLVTFDFQGFPHTVVTTSATNATAIAINNGGGDTDPVPAGQKRTVLITGSPGGVIKYECGIHGSSMSGEIHLS